MFVSSPFTATWGLFILALVSFRSIGIDREPVNALCLITWVSSWLLRYFYDNLGSILDLWIFLAFLTLDVGLKLWTYSSILAVFLLLVVFLACASPSLISGSGPHKEELGGPENHCVPALIPSRTTHSRMFPEKHSFAYSYLLVGIPIGPAGSPCRYGSLVSVDTDLLPAGRNRRGWFHVQGVDYLERGGRDMSLKAKLSQYLHSQGVKDESWHHAYLVTAPKFLGYQFNPVSFWYIYSKQKQLHYMVLEVNNTFDERRMYLLRVDNESSEKPDPKVTKFAEQWAKDFHVSPFNSRKGSYALTAQDPFSGDTNVPHVDNNIVLRSSERHAKLVARVFTDSPPIDPRTATTFQSFCFIYKWWWVGFVTFPRIVREAYKLYVRKKLDVFFRPEVLPTSVGRKPTAEETMLETFFRRYLSHLAMQSPLRVSYTPAPGIGLPEIFTPSKISASACEDIEIRVLTPAFYSRFVHYSHSSEAFDRECIFTAEKNCTVWISRPELLPDLPLGKSGKAVGTRSETGKSRLGWTLVKTLRCPPAASSYPDKIEATGMSARDPEDIRVQTYSTMDEYVHEHCPDAFVYRRCLLKLFLAQRYFAGFTEVLDLLDFALRLGLAYLSFDFARPSGRASGPRGLSHIVGSVFMVNLLHFWGIAKELSYRY